MGTPSSLTDKFFTMRQEHIYPSSKHHVERAASPSNGIILENCFLSTVSVNADVP